MEALMIGARVSMDNAFIEPEITTRLSAIGLTQEKVSEGILLLDNAQELYYRQIEEYGDKEAATEEVQILKAKANRKYMRHVKLAKVVLKQNFQWDMLQLEGSRYRTFNKWIDQVRAFYIGMRESQEILSKMTEVGVTAEDVDEGLRLADEIYALLANREKELGEARISTQRRNEAFEAFEVWHRDYQSLVKIALEDAPEYLEILGLD
jgi:hypothetical protein